MLRAEHEGERLTHDEVVANCVLLLFAGHETTTNLLGNGLFHLLRHPAQAALLQAQPARLHGAVEELLRYDGPVPATVKIATDDVPWHGRTIGRGDMVIPFMTSANRDPRQFPAPDTLDVCRDLGADHFARRDNAKTIGRLVRRLRDLGCEVDIKHAA